MDIAPSDHQKPNVNIANGDDELIEFLKDAYTILESRINMLDNKANILIGTQTLFFSVFSYFVKSVIEKEIGNTVHNLIVLVSIGEVIIFSITLMLLLLTLRPTWKLKMSDIKSHNMPKYVLWFSETFPHSFQDYEKTVISLTKKDMLKNYQRAHFTALQLIRVKYMYYRWAVLFSKALILTGSAIIIYVIVTVD